VTFGRSQFALCREIPHSECARKLAKNRRCKSPTGKV
jgi:hypothetical protein